jgi:hypothetical protein
LPQQFVMGVLDAIEREHQGALGSGAPIGPIALTRRLAEAARLTAKCGEQTAG